MPKKRSSRVLVCMAAGAIALATQAVVAEEGDVDEKKPIPPANAVEVSADELAGKPAEFVGLRVRVRAEIDDVYSPRMFTLDEETVGTSPDVLVLAPNGGAFPKDGDEVEVTGTVRKFVRAEIERDYDWFDLAEEYDVKYAERPVIVAESIRQVED